MTGSNTNSNIVFVMLQMRTAGLLQLPVPLMLASQTAGAAMGSAISPAKVVVGCSSTGQTGREGIVMRGNAATHGGDSSIHRSGDVHRDPVSHRVQFEPCAMHRVYRCGILWTTCHEPTLAIAYTNLACGSVRRDARPLARLASHRTG